MQITLQPDPKCLEFIRKDSDALAYAKESLIRIGVPESELDQWDQKLEVDVDQETIKTLHDGIKSKQECTWILEDLDGAKLFRLNHLPFRARVTKLIRLGDLPVDLIHLSLADLSFKILGHSLRKFGKLASLDLSNCFSLSDVSALGSLPQLTSLNLFRCKLLSDVSVLSSLPQLTSLNLSWCKSLTDVSVLGSLPQLTSLDLSWCGSLTYVSVLGSLPQLTSLNLSGCKSLTDVSVLGVLPQLTSLNLSGCESLTDVSALGSLPQLTSLDLSWCGSLTDVSVLGSLPQLTSLDLSWCGPLTDVSVLGVLPQLTSLNLSGCKSLTDVSALGVLPQLTSLNLSGCESLTDVSALGSLPQLTSLNLSGCGSLTDVSVLGVLPQLTSLNLSGCGSLTDVSVLGVLPQLTSLDLSECESLTDVSALGSLTQWTSLNLSGCKSLTDVSVLGSLPQLTSLNLTWCESLTDVSVLGSLTQLTSLNLSWCKSLTDVSALGSLPQLTSLDLSGCHRIIHEPKFKYLSKLESLKVDKHPSQITDILAHCAVARRDWGAIEEHLENWSFELGQAIQKRHPTATDLANSLAIGVPHLENLVYTFSLVKILHKGYFLSTHPWKHIFQGTMEISGFSSLVHLTKHLPDNDWTSGAIGGLCGIIPLLKNDEDGLCFSRAFIHATHKNHRKNAAFLKSVAAQWCLALKELEEFQLLDEWLDLFSQVDDSATLDDVHLEMANQALASHNLSGATIKAAEIRSPRLRDELLLKIADGYLAESSDDLAGDLLFRIVHADSRAMLARQLAGVPGFLESPVNLHRVLAACGNHPEEIQEVISIARNSEFDSLKPVLKKSSNAKMPFWCRWFSGFFSQWFKTK